MFVNKLKMNSVAEAVKKITEEEPVTEAEKVPTASGMRVYGSSYGNSAKARRDQVKNDIDTLKGPKAKELIQKDKEDHEKTKGRYDEAAKPDFLDMDKDGNKKESMKKAVADKNKVAEELKSETFEFHLTEGSYADLHKKFGDTHKIEYHSHVLYPKHTVTKFDNEKEAESHAKKTGGTVRMSVSPKMKNEELKGNQHKIDANNNNKIDGQDFAILRGKKKVKEDMSFGNKLLEMVRKKESCKDEVKKHEKRLHGKDGEVSKHVDKMHNEEVELEEKEMTDAEMAKREKIVKSMKKGFAGFRQRYGKDAKSVMYATATKQSMKEDAVEEEIDPRVRTKDTLKGQEVTAQSDDVGPNSNGRSTKVKFRGGPMKEEVKKSDIPAFIRKARGDKPLTVADVKAGSKDSISSKENLAKARGVSEGKGPESDTVPFVTNADQPPFEGPYKKIGSTITDKSGAKHTPMSRARDLARSAMKRIKTEMLGKAPGNNG